MTDFSHHTPRLLTEADSLADLNGTPRPGDLPPLPEIPKLPDTEGIRPPWWYDWELDFMRSYATTYGQACAAQSAARVVELERAVTDLLYCCHIADLTGTLVDNARATLKGQP